MTDITRLIKAAITALGSESKLAAAAGVAQPTINEAKRSGRVGPKTAVGIDKATRGVISKSALRPDLWPVKEAAQ